MSSERRRIVEQDLPGGWVVEMEWPEGVTQGGPGVLVIRPADPDSYPPGGISSTLLREVDFRDALDTLRRLTALDDRFNNLVKQKEQERTERLRKMLEKGVTDEYLALLSSMYVNAVNRGQGKVGAHLAEITGKSEAAIKNHLWQATRKGFLVRHAGRVGGEVTEKAREILRKPYSGLATLLDGARRKER